MKKQTKEEEEKSVLMDRETSTAFLTMFPTLIIGILAIATTKIVWVALIIIALIVYQFLMQKKFIEDYYSKKYNLKR